MKKIYTMLIIVLALYACSEKDSTEQVSSNNPYEQAFANCIKKMANDFNEDNPGPKLPSYIMDEMVAAGCDIIKTECNKDPEGAICQGLIDEYE